MQKTEDTNRWDHGQGDHSDSSNKKGRSKSSARRARKAHHKNKKREIIFHILFFSFRSIFISVSFLNLLKKRKRKKKILLKLDASLFRGNGIITNKKLQLSNVEEIGYPLVISILIFIKGSLVV